jgi:hypothetical protein
LDSGFIEAGFSISFTGLYNDQRNANQPKAAIHLTPVVAYSMLLLGFARSLYRLFNINDECLFQISFKNTLNYHPYGLHERYDMWQVNHIFKPKNRQHQNFKISRKLSPSNLSDDHIHSIGLYVSQRICRVFGFNEDVCFFNNKLSNSSMGVFQL